MLQTSEFGSKSIVTLKLGDQIWNIKVSLGTTHAISVIFIVGLTDSICSDRSE